MLDNHVVFLLLGLANGAVYASLGLALVIAYRSSGVINFATGTIALLTAYVYAFLRQGKLVILIPGLPQSINLPGGDMGFFPAAIVSLVVAALLGLALYGSTFRALREARPLSKAVASLGVMVFLTGLLTLRFANPVAVPSIFPTTPFSVGSIHVPEDRIYLAATVIAVGVLLWAGYRFTRFGLNTRAVAETEKGAYVSGISPDRVAACNWMIGAAVSGLAGILIAPITPLVPYSYTLFIVPALAAAIFGGFQRMGPVVVAGLAMGMLQSEASYLETQHSWLPQSGLPELVPLILIIVVLVLRAKPLPSRGTLLQPSLGHAPRPKSVSVPALMGIALGAIGLLALHEQWREALVTSFIFGIIALSQVVVTGYAGQVSLAQLTLAGVGAFLLSPLTTSWGVPFPIAPILAALGATVVGVLIGLPALRIRGLSLAVVTLSLAVTLEALWFQNSQFVGSNGKLVSGPSLFGIDLGPGIGAAFPRLSFCLVVLVVFVGVGIAVAKLRTSTLGTSMVAVRANERSAAASGINVLRTKLAAFAIAAFIAGLGGAMLGYNQRIVTYDSFDVLLGLGVFATVYLSGISSVSGGVLAGLLGFGGVAYYASTAWSSVDPSWYEIVSGIGLTLSVILYPDGIVGPAQHALARWRIRGRDSTRAMTFSRWIARNGASTPAAAIPGTNARNGAGTQAAAIPGTNARNGSSTPTTTVSQWRSRNVTSTPATAAPSSRTPTNLEQLWLTPLVIPDKGLLCVKGLSVHYGGVVAVDNVSFDVPEGTIIGLIGPNGAGKTTLIDAISGFSKCHGSVELSGVSLNPLPPYRRVRNGLGRTFQGLELWTDLTVEENVLVGHGAARRGALDIDATFGLLGLEELRDQRTGELSQGQRQLVSIARSLVAGPRVLLLDEPAAGLDTTESVWLGERLRQIRDNGVTILLVDHDMSLVLNLCDRIEVLDFGKLIAGGTPEEIRADQTVREAYLGATHTTPQTSTR
jgi:ABC-type branched-subunit amino acid transport system ATPase component/ABC-type branched-subunit amino acid transport system permease subunit